MHSSCCRCCCCWPALSRLEGQAVGVKREEVRWWTFAISKNEFFTCLKIYNKAGPSFFPFSNYIFLIYQTCIIYMMLLVNEVSCTYYILKAFSVFISIQFMVVISKPVACWGLCQMIGRLWLIYLNVCFTILTNLSLGFDSHSLKTRKAKTTPLIPCKKSGATLIKLLTFLFQELSRVVVAAF